MPCKSYQCQCHSHDHRGEDVVESGDLQHVAVRVWIPMNIFILSGHPQGLGTIIFTVSLLRETTIIGVAINRCLLAAVRGNLREAFYLLYELKVEFPQRLWSSSGHLPDPEQQTLQMLKTMKFLGSSVSFHLILCVTGNVTI